MDIEAKLSLISSVMKEDLGMKYKRIKSISNEGNSPKNLVLRQQFALKLIGLLGAGMLLYSFRSPYWFLLRPRKSPSRAGAGARRSRRRPR